MENYIGKTCPFCKTEIAETDAVKICPVCDIPHHESCWNENGGCTTFGCSGQNSEQKPAASAVCSNCGAPMKEDQAFCTKCGAAKQTVQKAFCTRCGAELNNGQAFCPACGHKVGVTIDSGVNDAIQQFNANISTQKKKSKKTPIIVAIILAIVAIFGGITYNIAQEKKAAEERTAYLEAAQDFYDKVLDSGVTMERIGNEIKESWRAYVYSNYYNGKRYYSVDSAISAALSYSASDVSKVKSAASSITALYKTLLSVPDEKDQELIALRNTIKDTFQAYQDMYFCIISPSGNYTSWTSEFGDIDTDLADAIEDLRLLLN